MKILSRKKSYAPKRDLLIIGLFFSVGLILGCLIAYLLRSRLRASLFSQYQYLLSGLTNPKRPLDSYNLFLFALEKHLASFFLLCVLSGTNLWNVLMRLILIWRGLQNGLLIAFCLQLKKIIGIVGYFCLILPQGLLLVPAFLITICTLQKLHVSFLDTKRNKKDILRYQLPALFAALILILSGCLLEAAANPALLRFFFR